jgi:hypothetical protein
VSLPIYDRSRTLCFVKRYLDVVDFVVGVSNDAVMNGMNGDFERVECLLQEVEQTVDSVVHLFRTKIDSLVETEDMQ